MSEASHDLPGATRTAAALTLPAAIIDRLRSALPTLAKTTVGAIMDEVPSYRDTLSGAMGQNIQTAVELAFVNFLRLAHRSADADPAVPLQQSTAIAYDLGRGEAKSGRTMEALLAAYRIGARRSWRELSRIAAESGLDAAAMGQFAELLFAYMDELTAASAAGHADQLATSGRVRERYLERLAIALITQGDEATVAQYAAQAQWKQPSHLIVCAAAAAVASPLIPRLSPDTLAVMGDTVGLDTNVTVLIVPAPTNASRDQLLATIDTRRVIVGPRREPAHTPIAFRRVVRALQLPHLATVAPLDTSLVLADLLVAADPDCHQDLQKTALAPLAALPASTRERLVETLRAFVSCQGRRDDMARQLFVHPQTVRYRMTKIKQLYGDTISDPDFIFQLTLALTPTSKHSKSSRR